jgi:predicted dehydrogenase
MTEITIEDHVRWGIIGCGNVCERKSGPAFNRVENSSIEGVMRRNKDLAIDFANRHHVPKWFTYADELINDPDINAIYVATPPDAHAHHALKCLTAGKPVFLEKPMALNYSECARINALADETGVPLYIAYYRREFPYYEKIKQELEQDTIGDVTAATLTHVIHQKVNDNTSWQINPDISKGGFFFDMASHQIDLLDFLIGPITDAHGDIANRAQLYDVADTVVANLNFQSGAIASCCWSYVGDKHHPVDKIEIYGLHGKITFSMSTLTPVVVQHGNSRQFFSFKKPEYSHIYMIEKIVNHLLGKKEYPSNRISAARINWVMDEILK